MIDLYIDNENILTGYGVILAKDSLKSILAYPSAEPLHSNNWHEYNGIEAAWGVAAKKRDVTINFIARRTANVPFFLDHFCDGREHLFDFRTIKTAYNLRFVELTKYNYINGCVGFSCKFVDLLEPAQSAEYFPVYSPPSIKPPNNAFFQYTNTQNPISDFGARVLGGTYNSILKTLKHKQNLETTAKVLTYENIAQYSLGGEFVYQYDNTLNATKKDTDDFNLSILITTQTIDELLWCYNEMWKVITRKNQYLILPELNIKIPFIYKNSKINEVYVEGKMWLKMELTLTATGAIENIHNIEEPTRP